jgi:cyclopropane fatty-acyl-phospholipid synthase-like methyltransferase
MYELTKQYYDRNAGVIVDLLKRYYSAALISHSDSLETCIADDVRSIIDGAALENGQTVLECGAGNGYFSRLLMERLPGVKYRGVDISASQVALARQINPRADIQELNYEEIDSPAGSFDRVLFLETLGYCINVDRLLDRLLYVVKPGGRVFVKNPGQKISDYEDFVRTLQWFEPVSREFGFDARSLGMIPDVDYIIKKFGSYGFTVAREAYPFFNEYFYNASFYAEPGICLPARCADKTTAIYQFRSFSPERSLSDLGKSHPRYIEYHRSISDGTVYQTRNRLYGCVVLVFVRS